MVGSNGENEVKNDTRLVNSVVLQDQIRVKKSKKTMNGWNGNLSKKIGIGNCRKVILDRRKSEKIVKRTKLCSAIE